MDRTMSVISDLDFSDVQDRVCAKYDVTQSDAGLAVEYVRCFFDAKRARPNELIILPQIADWAWHELILDTVRYRTVCSRVFGKFLHHVATTVDFDEGLNTEVKARDLGGLDPARAESRNCREEFLTSLAIMQEVYGLGLGQYPDQWLEAGWDRPAYRLRKPTRIDLDREAAIAGSLQETRPIQFLSWLPDRIARRFGVSVAAARGGVREYSELFLSVQSSSSSGALRPCSILCEIAWQEHILWTRRYADDCHRTFGYFLDHVPRADFSSLRDSAALSAA
jgi:hypothetical protein